MLRQLVPFQHVTCYYLLMQRGSVLPLLLIIVVALLSLVGVFFYSQATVSKQISLQTVRVSPLPSPTSRSISNEALGLNFEIPLKYSLKKETEKEYFKRAFGDIRKNFTGYILYPPAEFTEAFYIIADGETNLDKSTLTVWAFKNPDDLTPEGFYKKYWYYPFIWGEFSGGKEKIAPVEIELIGGKEGKSGVVDFRDGKPKFIYLPLWDKKLMLQIQFPTEDNLTAKKILESFKFE